MYGAPVMSTSDEYLLGMAPEEIQRLAQQHEAWRAPTNRVWTLAGIGAGHTVVDLGSGPGFTTLDLAEQVGPAGRVIAVDTSATALRELEQTATARQLTNIEVVQADVATVDISRWSPDAVTARWLFWFLPDAGRIVERIGSGLSAGATFAVMDYCNYRAIGTHPRSEKFDEVFQAFYRSCSDAGASLDIAAKIPASMSAAGLEVTHVEALNQVARPGSPVWQWVSSFQHLFMPSLVESGYITADDLESLRVWWAALSKNPNALFFAPPMLGVVGRKSART